jgi:hypothetical protein
MKVLIGCAAIFLLWQLFSQWRQKAALKVLPWVVLPAVWPDITEF